MTEHITVSRELLRQALDFVDHMQYPQRLKDALRAALEQPAVEPVAWIYQNANTESKYLVWDKGTGGRNWMPLFTAPTPPADVPLLTDDERYDLYRQVMQEHYIDSLHYWLQGPAHKYAIAIEQAVRQKAGLK